ncbi:hypothetical protein TNCV_1583051 [Trichonephila clavipes]|nr:hypothetical protein TNCV_1583051 [Trichonephila clavipes]
MRPTSEMALLSPSFHTMPMGGFRATTDLTCISTSARLVFSALRFRTRGLSNCQSRLQVRNYGYLVLEAISRE